MNEEQVIGELKELYDKLLWRAIESAPKDGTPILAYEHDWGYPLSIRWHQPWEKWTLNGVLLELGDWGQPEFWLPLPNAPYTGPTLGEQNDRTISPS